MLALSARHHVIAGLCSLAQKGHEDIVLPPTGRTLVNSMIQRFHPPLQIRFADGDLAEGKHRVKFGNLAVALMFVNLGGGEHDLAVGCLCGRQGRQLGLQLLPESAVLDGCQFFRQRK